ncbi:MAG: peptide ABC transporter substrate-binding protein [Anaerolineales bacterium]|nr:peptide ABC transporter substrate-binding protein [Anaerolineales bacterium]
MKPKTTLRRFFLAVAFLLFACQISSNAPTAVPDSGSASTPPSGSGSSSTATPIPPNTFVDPENGVSIRYPGGWTVQGGNNEQNLAVFLSPDSSIEAHLYVFPLQADISLQDAGAEIRQMVLTGMLDINVLIDEPFALDDGAQAWLSVSTASANTGYQLKVGLLTALFGAREVLVMTFGTPDAYDYYADDIRELQASLHLVLPSLYDIPRDQALVLSGGESTNPRDYDPATTHSSGDKRAFSGLVSFDPDLNLVPELAESWDISADGTVYTFYLRPNAVFHDGRPVTARDIVYSWERAADPATNSDTVLTYLGDIVGVEAMVNGEADHITGLQVINDYTLQVTLEAPVPYFLMKLTYPTAFVVDQANVESGAEWYRTPNGTGPYRLMRWDSFSVMIYARNENFYLGPPAIPYVVIELYSGVDIRLYEAGEIDIAGVYPHDVARVLDPDEPLHDQVISSVSLCTSYIVFDVTQPPFDDLKVRQAFNMAIDRQQYIDVVYSGVGVPAAGLFPPALPGYSLDLAALSFDPEAARRLLAESSYGGPNGLPPIIFTDAGIGNDAGPGTAALAQMWQQNLGVTIIVENLDPNWYYDLLYSGQHGQMVSTGWCADYPDPENFADVLFHTAKEQNLGNYSNPELDLLLDQARVEQDVTRRIEMYQQAEQIIVQDAPAIFLMHSVSYVLVKPHVQGYVLTPIDIPLERYLWIER